MSRSLGIIGTVDARAYRIRLTVSSAKNLEKSQSKSAPHFVSEERFFAALRMTRARCRPCVLSPVLRAGIIGDWFPIAYAMGYRLSPAARAREAARLRRDSPRLPRRLRTR